MGVQLQANAKKSMQTVSFSYLFFVISCWILFAAHRSILWKKTVFFVASAAYLCSFSLVDASYSFFSLLTGLCPVFSFIATGFISILLIKKYGGKQILYCAVIVQLFMFLYFKQYSIVSFVPVLPWPLMIVGLSYIFFRVAHLQVEAYHGTLSETPTFLSYLNYCFSFLTLQAGPIQPWNNFSAQEKKLSLFSAKNVDWMGVFSQVANGYLKVALVGAGFEQLRLWSEQLPKSSLSLSIEVVCYLLYLYYNFSGFMDISIGLGRAFGFDLPINFNEPLLSKSFLDLWSRWNITLSDWFKDYVFTPLAAAMTRKWGSPQRTLMIGVFCYLVTFFLMGVWHGTTQNFFFYGLALGFGAAMNKTAHAWLHRVLGKKKHLSLQGKLIFKVFASSLAISFFALALSFFWVGNLADAARVFLPFPRLLAIFLLVWLWVLLVQTVIQSAKTLIVFLKESSRFAVGTADIMESAYLAARLLAVVGLIFLYNDHPINVAYKVF